MSDNYDDIQGFEDDPEPEVVTEPDFISETQIDDSESKVKEKKTDEELPEVFEEMSEEELQGQLYGNGGNTAETQGSEDNSDDKSFKENDENSEPSFEDVSQSKKIMDCEPSKKVDVGQSKTNKGAFLNRSRIITILALIFVIFILFFTFVFPSIKVKKNKQKSKELDKNGKQYIPTAITNYSEDTENPIIDNFEDGNSASQTPEDTRSFEEKYPPLKFEEEPKNVAPVQVPSTSTTQSEIPLTNRNEQQKQPQRLTLDNTTSERSGGKKYPTQTVSGYNTGSNYDYSRNSTGASYTPQNLSSNVQNYLNNMQGGYGNSYKTQNDQSGKQNFLNKNGMGGNFQWNSEYSLWKGTVITAVLDTSINTDLPGQLMAHVSKNVYSSQDGKYMLIPQGSRLFGEYNSDVSYGQNRIQVVWNTLIRPDGLEINLGSLNGIDAYGKSGYAGWKTDHPFEYVKAFGLIAMYSILDTKANNLIDTQNNTYAQNAMSDVYSETKKLNNKIVERALDIQPTITIQSGTEINLITNVTIDLPPMESYEPEEKYVRE